MARSILQHVLALILTLVAITFLVFVSTRLIPGGAEYAFLDGRGASQPAAAVRQELGLDRPLPLQYASWLGDAVRGDFGRSLVTRRAIAADIRQRLPITLEESVLAVLLAVLLATPVGLVAAQKRYAWGGAALRLFATALFAIPGFWLGVLLIVEGAQRFGYAPSLRYVFFFDSPVANLRILLPPAIILALGIGGALVLSMRRLLVAAPRGAGRDAVRSIAGLLASQFSLAIGATVVLDAIFGVPGVGRYLITAVNQRDYPAIQATVLVIAIVLVFVRFAADLVGLLITGGRTPTHRFENPPIAAGRSVQARRSRKDLSGKAVLRFALRSPSLAFAGAIVLVLLLIMLLAGQIAPYDGNAANVSARLAGPSLAHLLGTDSLGRDIFSRIIYGARASILLPIGAVLLSTIIAAAAGIGAGLLGGWVDRALHVVLNIWGAVPVFVLLIALVALYGPPTTSKAILELGLLLWTGQVLVFRRVTLMLKVRPASTSTATLNGRHDAQWFVLLQGLLPVMMVSTIIQLAATILLVAWLNFLGLAGSPSVPNWAQMVNGTAVQAARAPLLLIWPGLAITVAVFGFTLLGDALADLLDPRLQGGLSASMADLDPVSTAASGDAIVLRTGLRQPATSS